MKISYSTKTVLEVIIVKFIYLLFVSLYILPVTLLASGEGLHWDYAGEEGPANWGELAAEFDMCRKGRNQSPIDLVSDINADLQELIFEYTNPGTLTEVNTGHAIQENVNPGNYLVVKGVKYELKQFHFHSPSEHTIGGKYFPMEIHLVHQNAEGEYAVVGLLFQEGKTNTLMNQLPTFKAERGEDPYSDPIDYNDLITNRKDYFLYNGSLTTPPCTEGVHWLVIKQPIIASPKQIQHFHNLLGFDNNRPIQSQNSRIILD
jgi:carbonic anhydrase